MDKLTAVKVFVEIANRGSLVQTAEALNMSTAMVSRYLGAVEDWLGARLLHRTTRKLSLTEAGLSALPVCRQLIDISEDLAHTTRHQSRVVAGKIRLCASASFAESQLIKALHAFAKAYPKVVIDLQVSDRAVNLTEERIDLAIRISNSLSDTLVAKRLTDCHSVLCASPDYLAEYGTPRTHTDLAVHQCVLHSKLNAHELNLYQGKQRFLVPMVGRFSSNETNIIYQAAKQGAGIAMLPLYYVAEDIKNGKLIRLLPEYELEVLGIYAVYLSRQHQPLALKTLLAFLGDWFADGAKRWGEG